MNPNAVAGLFVRDRSSLKGFLQRKLGGTDDAEDILQDAYVRLLSSDTDETGLRSPKSFLFTVALNLAIDSIRKRQRERKVINLLVGPAKMHGTEEFDIASNERPTELQVEDQMRLGRVLDSLRDVSENCRRAFILHKFMDMSYAEVAESLGVTVSMVEKHLSRALRCVREDHIAREALEFC